jgi:hypothetical protein
MLEFVPAPYHRAVSDNLLLAPAVPELDALGAQSPAELFEPARLATGARVELLRDEPAHTIWRVPLPGTPDASGRMPEKPRGAGTGWLWVQRYRGQRVQLLRARLTAPRSSSLAARQWNVICHLARCGVGVPDLVALVERGRGLSSESCLITRELEGFEPLAAWLARPLAAEPRAAGLESLRHFLAALARSRVALPGLGPDEVWIHTRAESAEASSDCAALDIERLRATRETRGELRAQGLAVRPLPAIACRMFTLGRIAARPTNSGERALLAALAEAGSRTPR